MKNVHVDVVDEADVQEKRGSDSDVEMESEAEEEEAEPEVKHFEVELSSRIMTLRVAVMIEATKKRFIEIVQILVGKMSEVEILSESKNDFTPLHFAAKHGFVDLIKLLCKQYPALINAANNENRLTPIHLACYYGQKLVVDELLAHGPNLSLLDESFLFCSPFVAACSVGALDIVHSLLSALPSFLENEGINVRDFGLNEGARRAHKEIVEYFLAHGGSSNAVGQYSNGALHWAAWNSNCRIMELFLLRRCIFDIKDDFGRTSLYDATRRDVNDCVRMLMNAGADLDCEKEFDCTPLNQAVYMEKSVLMRLLLAGEAKMELCRYRKQR